MSIDYIRKDEEMTIECDYCGDYITFEGSFQECIEQAKDEGWFVFKKYNDWIHICSEECRLDFNEENE